MSERLPVPEGARRIVEFPCYCVTRKGKVFSSVRGGRWHRLRPAPTSKGYLSVLLYRPDLGPKVNTSRTVHSLVAEAFLDPMPEPGYIVDHKNRNKTDNRASNLQWVTHKENTVPQVGEENGRAILSSLQASAVRTLATGPIQPKEIGEALGFDPTYVCAIQRGETWRHAEPLESMREAAEVLGLRWDGPDSAPGERWFTLPQAAGRLGTSRHLVRKRVLAGEFPEAMCRADGRGERWMLPECALGVAR